MSLSSALSQSTSGSWFSKTSSNSRTANRGQLHWKLFRKEVLAPHHIRIVDSAAGPQVPESILTWIEANRTNIERFRVQKASFRKQVANGRGFGSSALFPQEVLPSNHARPFLSRCMVPTFSADALPEKIVGKAGAAIQKSDLSLPRPGLGCGFSSSAFAAEEVNCMPQHMLATGTTVNFEDGSINSGSVLYCPFLNYERVFTQNEYGLEIAANQCAIDGAWSVRALQMLYAKASGEDADYPAAFANPVAFSCAIDNNIAIVNYHWVDHAQTYCMSPIVQFELAKDDHFNQFLLWTEAIGQWGLTHLLPEVKKAVSLLSDYVSALPALVSSLKNFDNNKRQEEEGLVSALKLTYDNIPWRFEKDDYSCVSSSTASWGSPMINEAVFAKFEYPIIPQPVPRTRSVYSDSNMPNKVVRFTGSPKMLKSSIIPKQPKPPANSQNGKLVLEKRLGHAMNEITELHSQLAHLKQELLGSTTCIQNELSGLRKTMTCVIRKEKIGVQQQGGSTRSNTNNPTSFVQTEQRLSIQKGVSIVTTPTDPRARPVQWPSPRGRVKTPSSLQNVLTLDTSIETVSCTNTAGPEFQSAIDTRSPITIFSPTIVNIHAPTEDVGALVRVPNYQGAMWSQVTAMHVLSALVPATMLRVLFLGCLLDYCMMTMTRSATPSITQYFVQVLENAVY